MFCRFMFIFRPENLCHVISIWSNGKDLVSLAEDGAHDGDDVGLVSEAGEAEDALELLEANHRGCSGHEPHDRRVR